MSSKLLPAATRFFGGRVCLDFANTVDWRTSGRSTELVPDYAALLSWGVARRVLSSGAAARLGALARANPAGAQAAHARAHRLRADIWRMAALLEQSAPLDLAPLNALLATLPAQPALSRDGAAYLHDLPGASLEEPLWPVLWSLTAVLASPDAGRVACCHAAGCGWLFVDESPNRSRLWCSSEGCGNRERARRAYARRRGGRG